LLSRKAEPASLILYCYFNQEQLHQKAPSSTIDLTGRCPSASELEELLNSSEQQSKTRNTISKLNRANHLGTHGHEIMVQVRKHKKIDQVLYSRSAAAESKVERMKLCRTVQESVVKGQDHMLLGEWDEQCLHDVADRMYRATELADQLSAKHQHIPFTPSGTRFEPEKLSHDQKLILAHMRAASPTIYRHVIMQMTANPNLPIHTPNLPPWAKLLDAKNRI